MESHQIYEKDGVRIKVSDKFIYCSEIYQIWSNGASLVDESYYASSKPLKPSKHKMILKKNTYILQRFLDLEFAPETFLINNGFKLLKDETNNY